MFKKLLRLFKNNRKLRFVGLALCALLVAVIVFALMPPEVSIAASSSYLNINISDGDTPFTESRSIDNGDGTYTYKDKWLCSYETLLFDTSSDDMEIGYYAVDETGKGFYYRNRPAEEAQFEWTDNANVIKGLVQVAILPGHTYYDEFLTAQGAVDLWTDTSAFYMVDPSQLPSGGVLRVQSNAKKYWDTAQIANYPQPEKTEIVTKIPPDEPSPEKPEHHSIALDVASNSGDKGAVSSYSWSHTCTGTNLLLSVGDDHRSYNYGPPDVTVTGIKHNGSAMTYIRSDVQNSDPYWRRSTLYYIIAPATGAKTIAVTLSGTVENVCGGGISYTGAKQSGQPDNHNGGNGTTSPASISVTTVADNCWVISTICGYGGLPLTCGNTERWHSAAEECGSDTNGPKHPAGAQAMSWTSGWITWAMSVASFAPVAEFTGNITIDPSSKAFGIVAPSTTYYAKGSPPNNPVQDGDCTFTLTNNGDTAKINVHGHSFTGGVGWTLTSGAPGSNTVRITVYQTGTNPANGVVLTTSDQQFIASLTGAGAHTHFDFKFETGTFTDGIAKTAIITYTAVAP